MTNDLARLQLKHTRNDALVVDRSDIVSNVDALASAPGPSKAVPTEENLSQTSGKSVVTPSDNVIGNSCPLAYPEQSSGQSLETFQILGNAVASEPQCIATDGRLLVKSSHIVSDSDKTGSAKDSRLSSSSGVITSTLTIISIF